jgi:hypothetical protein
LQFCAVYSIVVFFCCFLFLSGKNSVPASSLSLCELLLRVDSMVISGLLSKGEAFELRNKLLESKFAIHDAFEDIYHKADTELLSELRTISEKSTKYVRKQYYCKFVKFCHLL